MDVFQKIENLPEDVRNFFCSNDSRLAIERACFLYEIREEDIKKIAKPIAQIFFKEIELSQLPLTIEREFRTDSRVAYGVAYELNVKLFSNFGKYFIDAATLLVQWKNIKISPIISEEKAQRRVSDIEPWILENEKEEAKEKAEARKKIDSINITAALQKYPKLGEQNISSNPIKLRYFPTPVRPSIKNWITDFHDNMGAGKHGSIDRGNYLFHSENGKRLTPIERQKLSELFKSLDEQTSINIDIEAQTIAFGSGAEERERGNVSNSTVAAENDDIFQRYVSHPQPRQQAHAVRPYSPPNFAAKPVQQSNEHSKNESASSGSLITRLTGITIGKKQPIRNVSPDQEALHEDVIEPIRKTSSPNFAASEGIISFSSSQKLPVEQKTIPAKTVPRPIESPRQMSQPQPMQSPQPQIKPQTQPEKISRPQPIRQSQWHIAPAGYDFGKNNDEKKDAQPKIDKNIVDLRN